jgi:hypothetical protein
VVILEGNGLVFKSYIGGKFYVGSMKDNVANGLGFVLFNNGDRYLGSFLNGRYNGNGILYKNGDRYNGNFLDGKKSGQGFISYEYGGWYDGEWKNDMYDGMGELGSSDGQKSIGLFSQNVFVKSKADIEQEKINEQNKTAQERIAEENSKKQEITSTTTNTFSCSFDFENIDVSGVSYTLLDNRKICKKCDKYALYKTRIDDFQKLAEDQYQRDVIGYHIHSIMSDEVHHRYDVLRHPSTIKYKSLLIYLLNSESNEKRSTSDDTLFKDCAWLYNNNNKPNKVIKFDKYIITSEYYSTPQF